MVRINMRLEEGPILMTLWHLPKEDVPGKDFDLYTLRIVQGSTMFEVTSRDRDAMVGFLHGLHMTAEEEGLYDDE